MAWAVALANMAEAMMVLPGKNDLRRKSDKLANSITIVAMLKCDDEDGCCGSFGDCLVKKAEAGQFAGPVAQGNA